MKTTLTLDDDTVIVRHQEDAQDLADWVKSQAEQPQHGRDFHHKWSLPPTQVIKFFNEYCGDGNAQARAMNAEFWAWVDQKMKDPQYRVFWAYDPAKPFFMGYGD